MLNKTPCESPGMSERIEQIKQQIGKLDSLLQEGVLPAEQAAEARARLERELLDLVMATPLQPAQAVAVSATPNTPRPSSRMVWGMVAFVALAGAGGYAWLGSPDAWHIGPGNQTAWSGGSAESPETGSSEADTRPHATDAAQITAMTESLAAKLAKNPDNSEGWAMLARSYAVLGRFQDAVPAYQKAIALRPGDAQIYADYADAVGATHDRKLEAESARLIDKALSLDPNNFKALFLSGTMAYDRQDYRKAADLWQKALSHAPSDNPEMTRQVGSALNDARQKLGLPPQALPEPVAVPSPMVGAAAAEVAGQVTLGQAAQGKVKPDDTVFIFARASQGPKMPLAIVRKQVKDLPVAFSLTDEMAMSPQMKLSTYGEVVVSARVSASGSAMPQPGDWQGQSQAVKVGTRDIRIDISDQVR